MKEADYKYRIAITKEEFKQVTNAKMDQLDYQNFRIPGQEWNFDDIKEHQEKMLTILLG